MPNYRLSPAAKSDLLEIWNYTVETWGEKQAEKYLLDIETKLERLAANPELGKQRPEISPGYYSFPVEKHIIFYQKSCRLRKWLLKIGLDGVRIDNHIIRT